MWKRWVKNDSLLSRILENIASDLKWRHLNHFLYIPIIWTFANSLFYFIYSSHPCLPATRSKFLETPTFLWWKVSPGSHFLPVSAIRRESNRWRGEIVTHSKGHDKPVSSRILPFVSMMIKYYFDLCKLELVSMLRQGCNHSICYQTVDYELCTEASVYTNNI